MRTLKLPSPNEWLAKLAGTSPNLAQLVADIKGGQKSVNLYKEFQRNPFQRDDKGQLRFIVKSFEDPKINLLEVFDGDLDAVTQQFTQELQASKWGRYFSANRSGIDLLCPTNSEDLILSPQYHGPKLFLYPDANIEINPVTRRFLRDISNEQGIIYDILTIINHEKAPGGLAKRFKNLIPIDLARGQQSLEKRCSKLDEAQQSSMNLFFDKVTDYFDDEVGGIYDLSASKASQLPEDLAVEIAKQKGRNGPYQRFVTKLIETHRAGNLSNYLADKILATTSFGFNLISPQNRSVVISNDRDLSVVFDNLYDEILPRYMADITVRTMEEKGITQYSGLKEALYQAARKQVKWAKESGLTQNVPVQVLYVPDEDRFYTKEISSALRHFFNGLEDYRMGKSELIAEMARTGQSPEKVVERLMSNDYASAQEN